MQYTALRVQWQVNPRGDVPSASWNRWPLRRGGLLGRSTVADMYKAFWAFLGIASPDCSGFKNQPNFFGVARSTYVRSPFRNNSRVGGEVEI